MNEAQRKKGEEIIHAWKSGAIEWASERDELLRREGLKPEDFGVTPSREKKATKPRKTTERKPYKELYGQCIDDTKKMQKMHADELQRLRFVDEQFDKFYKHLIEMGGKKNDISYELGRSIVESIYKAEPELSTTDEIRNRHFEAWKSEESLGKYMKNMGFDTRAEALESIISFLSISEGDFHNLKRATLRGMGIDASNYF